MGFGAERTKRDTRRDQPFANIGDAFYCIHGNRLIFAVKIH